MTASKPNKAFIIMKFGGTSVATKARWQTIRQLAASRCAENAHVMIVVSALSGVTDKLKAMTDMFDGNARARQVEIIIEQHHALLEDMQLEVSERLAGHFKRLRKLAETRPDGDDYYRWCAHVQAHGELMSSSLGADFLNQNGLGTHWLDSRRCLRTAQVDNENKRRHYLFAVVDAQPNKTLQTDLSSQGDVFIGQGFIASDSNDATVLLGRGGSDTSAAYFGALLEACRVETWTDVAGMFSANPRQVQNARLLKRLDYEEAQEIASTGAKILHPRCLSPLRGVGVPLLIKDTNHPEIEGTIIGPRVKEGIHSIKALSTRKNITLISMESVGMWRQVGFLADVFAIFKTHGLSVDLIGSAETNVTVSLDSNENLMDTSLLAKLVDDLSQMCRVKVIEACAAITLVGRGMRSMMHTLAPVMEKLEHSRVHLVTQSSNNLNMSFVVDEDVVDALVPQIHELLLRSGSLRGDDSDVFGPSWTYLYGQDKITARADWWQQDTCRQALLRLAREQTPAYVYHLPTIVDRARALKNISALSKRWYAIKANTHPQILKTMAAEGFGLECVSPRELLRAREVAPDAELLFTPNFADREDYAKALELGAYVTLDAIYPLKHWPQLFANQSVLLRVDLGHGLGHHEKVRTGGDGSKFGITREHLDEAVALAHQHHVRIIGLHCHSGSGVLDVGHWQYVGEELASFAKALPDVRYLNLGGGLGVPMHPGETALDLNLLRASLDTLKKDYPDYDLWLEPGRFLVAESGVLLAHVTQLKSKGDKHYLGINAGMHNLIRPALYDAWHDIVNLSRATLDNQPTELYQVVGPICETGDVLGCDRRIAQAQGGDVILIANTGAYGASMASDYNLREAAQEYLLEV